MSATASCTGSRCKTASLLFDNPFEYLIEIPTTGMYGFTLYPYNWNGNKDKLNIGDYAEFWDMQLERGSTATTYEPFTPYIGTTTTITLRDTDGKLHTPKSLPDGTRDEVDLDGGESVERVKKVSSADFTWNYQPMGSANCMMVAKDYDNVFDDLLYDYQIRCSNYKSSMGAYNWQPGYILGKHEATHYAIYIVETLANVGILEEDDTTIRTAKVKAYIATNPFTIQYKLATPKTWHLHPDEVKKIVTVESEKSYIYTNAEVQPELSVNAISYGED